MSTQLGGQPVYILTEGTTRNCGRHAQNMNITAAISVASAVRTTLGPKGMDKMLVDSIFPEFKALIRGLKRIFSRYLNRFPFNQDSDLITRNGLVPGV